MKRLLVMCAASVLVSAARVRSSSGAPAGARAVLVASGGPPRLRGGSAADAMVCREDITTPDQCVGHADAAMAAGDFEDAVDFLHAALEEMRDELGDDAQERAPVLVKYAKALMQMEAQNMAEAARSEQDAGADESSQDGDSSGPEDATHAAWRSLEEAKRIIQLSAGRETKDLADVFELQAGLALDGALKCPELEGKPQDERRKIARIHLQTCLRIRGQLFEGMCDSMLPTFCDGLRCGSVCPRLRHRDLLLVPTPCESADDDDAVQRVKAQLVDCDG